MEFQRAPHPENQGYRGLMNQIPTHLSTETRFAAETAIMAGDLLLERNPRQFVPIEKSVGDYVTEVDVELDALIRRLIRCSYPGDTIISEESASEIPNQAPLARTWVVDPLDGTSAYLSYANKYVSVMIAFMDQGHCKSSVIYAPFSRKLFIAEEDKGAYWEGVQFYTSHISPLKEIHVAFNQYMDARYETEGFVKLQRLLRSEDGARLVTVSPPSSIIGCMAMSKFGIEYGAAIHDHNPMKPKQEIWDVLPVQLFVKEAGGYFGDLRLNEYDPWNQERGPILICGTRSTALQICHLLNSCES